MHDRWYDDPWRTPVGLGDPHLDRLTHLVLVDGRLVDTWSEPVDGTRWAHHAERFDRELRRPAPPPPPPPPHEQALAWLAAVAGPPGALTTEPLTGDGLDLPDTPPGPQGDRLAAVADLLDAVAVRCFDTETSHALRAALLELWRADPGVVTESRSAAHVAGGTCWVVGRANQLFRPQGTVTMGRVQDALALSTSLATAGAPVRAALWGLRSPAPDRPPTAPDLLAVGRPGLLLGATRARLVRLRDRAEAARDAEAA